MLTRFNLKTLEVAGSIMQQLRSSMLLCGSIVLLLTSACSGGPTGPQTGGGSGNTTSPFNIEVRYIGTPTSAQRSAVESAVTRWRKAIRSELTDVPLNVQAARCFTAQPALNETIDDMLIYVEFVAIDGVGRVLGQAGPCFVRTVGGLPIFGHLQLDVADTDRLETQGRLDDLLLHEMAHVLGFGTLWEDYDLLMGSGTSDPVFGGSTATAAFKLLNPQALNVPVENTGQSGTRDGHWRESVLGSELMTGYLTTSTNPLSRVTIASFDDMGYTTNASAADQFTLGGGVAGARIDIHGGEDLVLPRYRVDPNGIIRQITSITR
jgi:hypothetical protein